MKMDISKDHLTKKKCRIARPIINDQVLQNKYITNKKFYYTFVNNTYMNKIFYFNNA